jgi:hypothetical protein
MTGKSFSDQCQYHQYRFERAVAESEFWYATYIFACDRCPNVVTISQTYFWTGKHNA